MKVTLNSGIIIECSVDEYEELLTRGLLLEEVENLIKDTMTLPRKKYAPIRRLTMKKGNANEPKVETKVIVPNEFGKFVAKNKEDLLALLRLEYEQNGYGCNLNNIDVSNITDMSHLFENSDFNGDISEWDVSNVNDMSFMFSGSSFNGDISKWNVSKVTDMEAMFSSSDFNGDISKWNVSNVVNMSGMFDHSKFNNDISKWDVSNVENMFAMFYNSKFQGNISKWNVKNVKIADNMFDLCEIRESNKPNFIEVEHYEPQVECVPLYGCVLKREPISLKNTPKLENDINFSINEQKVKEEKATDYSKENSAKVSDFLESQSFTMGYSEPENKEKENEYNQNIPKIDKVYVEIKLEKEVAKDREHLKEIIKKNIDKYGNNCDLTLVDVSNVTDMNYLFEDSDFNGNISNWDVSHVINMHGMFYKSKFNGNISKWDVSNVKDMNFMFADSEFKGDISKWNVSKYARTIDIFNCCSIPLSHRPEPFNY